MPRGYFIFILLCCGGLLPRKAVASDSVTVHSLLELDSISLRHSSAFVVDETNSLNWQAVMQKDFATHENLPKYIESKYGKQRVTLWLRFTLHNATPDSINSMIYFFRYTYFKEAIALKKGDTIISRPNYVFTTLSKEVRKDFVVPVAPGEEVTFLVRIYNPYANFYKWPITLTYQEAYKKARMVQYHHSYPSYIFQIMFLAVVLFITLHTLAQYFIRRRREFVLYALYTISVFLFFLYRLEFSIYYNVLFSYFPGVYKFSNNLLSIIIYILYFRFARQFVDFQSLAPWFYKVLVYTERLLLAAFAVDLLCSLVLNNYELRDLLFTILRITLLAISFAGIFILLRSGKRVHYFFGIGSLVLIIGSLLAMLYTFFPAANPLRMDPMRYMQYGIILELLCFTSGLSYKSHLIEIEKRTTQAQLIKQLEENRRLQQELNMHLEERVKEQTEQIMAQQQQLEKEKEQKLTLEFTRKITEMELQLLKSQLNPHFYFNTLNNLYGLAMIAPKKAPDAILKLSDIMEYVIYDCRNDKVPLLKELKFLQSYVDLEKLRYEDNAKISLDVRGSAGNRLISPMLLIQFVENGFKHGMEREKGDSYLQITIQATNGHLLYESINSNNNQAIRENGAGVGLTNARKRLEILYPGMYNLEIISSTDEFKVKLDITL